VSYTDTLASVGFRARRIEAAECGEPSKADRRQAERQCLDVLEQCAAEAFANRWFPRTPIQSRRRSVVVQRVYETLRDHGPLMAPEIMAHIGHQRSATDKALRELRDTGRVVVVGRAKRLGNPQIYGIVEEGV
jgi:hypothetical protein